MHKPQNESVLALRRLGILWCALTALAGCSGGGSSAAPAALHLASSVAHLHGYDIHVVVEDGKAVTLALLPHGASLPGAETAIVPFAPVQYPDGSIQAAGADGSFEPAQSAYGLGHALLLENDADAAPYVIVSDPLGRAAPIVAQVDAAADGPAPPGDVVPLNAYVHLLGGNDPALAALALRPRRINLRAGESTLLEASALDATGHLSDVPGTVVWSRPAGGGTLVPIPGTAAARYTAPLHGTGVAGVSAAVLQPGAPAAYAATNSIAYFDASSFVGVAGTLDTGQSPVDGELAFYQASPLPGYLESFFWFAQVHDGRFQVRLPRDTTLVPLAKAASAAAFAPALGPGGSASFMVPELSRLEATFTLVPGTPPFVDPGVSRSPPVAEYIRDAWYAPAIARCKHVFDADSGLQSLLAHPGSPSAGTVSRGTYAGWRFAWSRGSLELIEADGAGRPGRESAEIVPAGGGFAYTLYRSTGPLALDSHAVARQPDSLVTETGTWKQSAGADGAFRADVASLVFTPSHQAVALYAETSTYARDASGAVSLTQSVTDASNQPLWTASAKRSGLALANAGTPLPVFRYSAVVRRAYRSALQTAEVEFDASGSSDGDGSGTVAYRNAASGVTTSYHVLPSASLLGTADLGTVSLGDAGRPYASMTIDLAEVVRASLGDGTPGGTVSSIAFPL